MLLPLTPSHVRVTLNPDLRMEAAIFDDLTALADATRSRMLLVLERHELTVGELCSVLQLPQSTVSRHLKLLADDGWVIARGGVTSRFYKMLDSQLDGPTKDLWSVVGTQVSGAVGASQDARRAESILAKRRDKAQVFFLNQSAIWD